MTASDISVALSVLAVGLSGLTLYLTYFRRGKVRMTQPTAIFFGPDENGSPKVFLRTLLYSTAKRGQILEHMYVTLRRGETRQTFNIWVYGDKDLSRGSGLFVGDTGVTANHHFLLPAQETGFRFRAGDYDLEVRARRVGDSDSHTLAKVSLPLSAAEEEHISKGSGGVYFDWGPESGRYHSHLDTKAAVKKYTDADLVGLVTGMKDAISRPAPMPTSGP
jgi:hypothetical protein